MDQQRTVSGPSPAERARTLAYGVAGGVLVTPGVPYAPIPAHAAGKDGAPLLLLPAASPVATALVGNADLPATLRISDVAPVPFPDRVRGRAWLHGWISEVPPAARRDAALRLARLHPRPELLDLARTDGGDHVLLTLDVAQIEVDDPWGSATVEPEDFAQAGPDPFAAIEAGVLAHLDGCHRAELRRLLPELGEPAPDVRPLGLDRLGLWLRCSIPSPDAPEPFDLRVPFPHPAHDLPSLRHAYACLWQAAAK
ncbi:hypothetical protein BTM25_19990 [Actinomadura rubteroloni]|uniref:DUF2470 domain-containing protein n=1 Tax=Actinomadura rubteroloni TaxID=1926885 RepID=A0A2P4URB3_9ACTN|nr:DUF2470 domain-containing protein [Actinomadura rubteroloni]POM27583.1 hypothetical protein BTM25_19990 [Actinomadura rubteroloni]